MSDPNPADCPYTNAGIALTCAIGFFDIVVWGWAFCRYFQLF